MDYCESYKIDCPYAFESENAPVLCVGSWEDCENHRKILKLGRNRADLENESPIMKIKRMKEE